MNELNRQKQLQSAKEQSDRNRAKQDSTLKTQTRSQKALSKSTISFADKLNDYILPIASTTTLGAIKVGANLTIDVNGILNASGGAGATNWGLIGGSIRGAPQADLVAELDAKADISHALVHANHTASGLTTGHFLKATSATTYAFGAHGLTAADVGAIADPGTSTDYQILTWNGASGNSVRTSVGVKIDSNYNVVGDADIVAYQSSSYTGSIWDGLPVDNLTLKYTLGTLSIKPSVTGNASKYLRVNSGETGLEWADAATINSQWTTSGSDIYFANKVMIGNASAPYNPLNVVGTYSAVSLTANSTAVANFIALNHTQLAISHEAASPYAICLQTKHATNNGSSYPLVLNPLGGNVGIGIAPGDNQQKLQVHTASDTNLSIRAGSDFGAGYSGSAIDSLNDAITVRKMLILAGNPIVMTGGNVGIGTASPSPKLMVDSVADTQHGLYVKRTTSTSDYWCGVFYNSATGIEADLAGKTYSAIFNGGNVGIGTASPGCKLQVNEASTNGSFTSTIRMYVSGAAYSGSGPALDFYNQDNSAVNIAGRIATALTDGTGGAQSDNMIFQLAASGTCATRMTLTSAGALSTTGSISAGTTLSCDSHLYVNGVGSNIYFDTLSSENDNYIGTANNYQMKLYCGRGTTTTVYLTENGRVDVAGGVRATGDIIAYATL